MLNIRLNNAEQMWADIEDRAEYMMSQKWTNVDKYLEYE